MRLALNHRANGSLESEYTLIQYVYQTLSNIDNKDIEVKRNYTVKGKSGTEHKIDVFYEFQVNDITHSVIFECKNWGTNVTKEKIATLITIRNDIPNSVGVLISTKRARKRWGYAILFKNCSTKCT